MKRLTTFGLLVLGMVIGLSPIAWGQSSETPSPPGQVLAESRILIAINRAGLSLEQLQALQAMVQATIEIRDEIVAAVEGFQEFLANWRGSAEEFEAALQEEQQKLKDLRDRLHELWSANGETIKGMLTAGQFAALRPVLRPVIGPPPPRRDQETAGRPGVGRPGRKGPSFSQEFRLLKGLDPLNEALREKLELLQS